MILWLPGGVAKTADCLHSNCKYNRPKDPKSTLTHSTPLVQRRKFNKLRNLGQTLALVLFGKGQKIHKTTLTNPCSKLGKSM